MRFPVLFILLVGIDFQLLAQLDRATLSGTLTDASGAVIPGARVEVLSQETGLRREAQSTESGTYTFPQLPIGAYTITVSHAGLRTVTMKDLRLGVGDNRTLDLTMDVSTTETSITVQEVLAPLDQRDRKSVV